MRKHVNTLQYDEYYCPGADPEFKGGLHFAEKLKTEKKEKKKSQQQKRSQQQWFPFPKCIYYKVYKDPYSDPYS